MATFPIYDGFNEEKSIGEVVLNDETARDLADNAELVELIPMLNPNGTIVCFTLTGSAFEELDADEA